VRWSVCQDLPRTVALASWVRAPAPVANTRTVNFTLAPCMPSNFRAAAVSLKLAAASAGLVALQLSCTTGAVSARCLEPARTIAPTRDWTVEAALHVTA
jgi:hypothetical protein